MSILFGKVLFDGTPLDPTDLDRVRPLVAPYGPDGETILCNRNFGMIFRTLHTTKESQAEVQPHVTHSGLVFAWDGRLDNREDLVRQLGCDLSDTSSDLSIIVSAYDRWRLDSFAKLLGDWALSIWDPASQSLVLAKDYIGARHLYYSIEKGKVSWCSILDPLVTLAGHSFALDEEYIAGWLSFSPATNLSPYVGIRAVPPSSFLRLTATTHTIVKYWDFDPAKRIRYDTDVEYEEQFRTLFEQAVRRRLRSQSPVLAELSGGLDSSSIVCIADMIAGLGQAQTPRLDTVSYFDDSEPNWDERPYFSIVEAKRGKPGCHIDVCPIRGGLRPTQVRWGLTPSEAEVADNATRDFRDCLVAQDNRVLLSGFGGDEVLGGVPTPIPELADYLCRARLICFAQKLQAWALTKRTAMLDLVIQTVKEFLPDCLNTSKAICPLPWLQADFVARNKNALHGYENRLKFFAGLPSFQEHQKSISTLRRHIGSTPVPCDPAHEIRYPYLDRDLLEFLHAIPQEQLVRPGHRRSLLRRSLSGIVPEEILNRKRKAFVARGPAKRLRAETAAFLEHGCKLTLAAIGVVHAPVFAECLKNVEDGYDVPLVALMRTVDLEQWLRAVSCQGFLDLGRGGAASSPHTRRHHKTHPSRSSTLDISAEENANAERR